MDFVEWCDSLADGIADYAELHDRWVHLHPFADYLIDSKELPSSVGVKHAVILDADEVLNACGIRHDSDLRRLTRADIARLRDRYIRWAQAQTPLDDSSLHFLHTLNELSQRPETLYTTADDVSIDDILRNVEQALGSASIDGDFAIEILDGLEAFGLARSRRYSDTTLCKCTYLGVARTNRSHILADQEIDLLRTAGESDSLDYKRYYKLASNDDKWEFAKDVTALANGGGIGPRYLLVGVDDDGTFYAPPSDDDAKQHRALLETITETRLQQILTSRTTHSPSVRLRARGEHRHGPYVLIEVIRDVRYLPYRVYQDQNQRTAPNAEQYGEVWIRKGTTKGKATPMEIAALEGRAALYQGTFS
jgi:hypothetical protein